MYFKEEKRASAESGRERPQAETGTMEGKHWGGKGARHEHSPPPRENKKSRAERRKDEKKRKEKGKKKGKKQENNRETSGGCPFKD
jgi:hypothetical protein